MFKITNQCFKWAVLAKHVTGEHKNHIGTNYTRHEVQFQLTSIPYTSVWCQNFWNKQLFFVFILFLSVYNYEYTNKWEKLNKTTLPPIEKFYSSLNESYIEKSEYEHAVKVRNLFNCKNLGSYMCINTIIFFNNYLFLFYVTTLTSIWKLM